MWEEGEGVERGGGRGGKGRGKGPNGPRGKERPDNSKRQEPDN